MEKKKRAIIVGAGLVGSLWAVYLSKAGYAVTIYERRSDIRKAEISAGKSINLSLSARGWKALDAVGVGDAVREISIPMYGRTMHSLDGELSNQPYGKEGQAIYSVSRGGVNALMMDVAETHGNAEILYNHLCEDVDLEAGKVWFKKTRRRRTYRGSSRCYFCLRWSVFCCSLSRNAKGRSIRFLSGLY